MNEFSNVQDTQYYGNIHGGHREQHESSRMLWIFAIVALGVYWWYTTKSSVKEDQNGGRDDANESNSDLSIENDKFDKIPVDDKSDVNSDQSNDVTTDGESVREEDSSEKEVNTSEQKLPADLFGGLTSGVSSQLEKEIQKLQDILKEAQQNTDSSTQRDIVRELYEKVCAMQGLKVPTAKPPIHIQMDAIGKFLQTLQQNNEELKKREEAIAKGEPVGVIQKPTVVPPIAVNDDFIPYKPLPGVLNHQNWHMTACRYPDNAWMLNYYHTVYGPYKPNQTMFDRLVEFNRSKCESGRLAPSAVVPIDIDTNVLIYSKIPIANPSYNPGPSYGQIYSHLNDSGIHFWKANHPFIEVELKDYSYEKIANWLGIGRTAAHDVYLMRIGYQGNSTPVGGKPGKDRFFEPYKRLIEATHEEEPDLIDKWGTFSATLWPQTTCALGTPSNEITAQTVVLNGLGHYFIPRLSIEDFSFLGEWQRGLITPTAIFEISEDREGLHVIYKGTSTSESPWREADVAILALKQSRRISGMLRKAL